MSSSKNPKDSLVASIMQFLTEQLSDSSLNDDAKESIEGTNVFICSLSFILTCDISPRQVAIQCLETAFNINPVDGSLPARKPLLDIYSFYLENNKEVYRFLLI